MPEEVIRVEDLSKQYRLGTVGTGSLSHDLNRWWCKLRGKPDPFLKVTESNDRAHKGHSAYVWALQDISFTVRRGEVLGIIGRNGAGKSTLLKILSRITAPTTGKASIKGRIGSLLEVGTGFHPELTGRENIFLNGAILGMTKAEIRSKLDAIVEFSGCERYLDTPVKRYSSGMMVRLGFAVAAHFEPEILIVDEVLAVGDAEFQKKCLGKMKDVAEHGRTVLFVSHNLSAVKTLCDVAICLDEGALTLAGETECVVESYVSGLTGSDRLVYVPSDNHPGAPDASRIVDLLGFRVHAEDGNPQRCTNGDTLTVEAIVRVRRPDAFLMCVPVWRGGDLAFVSNSHHRHDVFRIAEPGVYRFRLSIPPYLLNPGMHEFSLYIGDEFGAHEHHIRAERSLRIDIHDDGVRRGGQFHGSWPGAVSPLLDPGAVRLDAPPDWTDTRPE
jgi:lipopolysaccharide transport system ATP-binding protein